MPAQPPTDERKSPLEAPQPEPTDDDSELDAMDVPCTDADDAQWDVFIPDDDERDPLPDSGDFGGGLERRARSMEFD